MENLLQRVARAPPPERSQGGGAENSGGSSARRNWDVDSFLYDDQEGDLYGGVEVRSCCVVALCTEGSEQVPLFAPWSLLYFVQQMYGDYCEGHIWTVSRHLTSEPSRLPT